MIKIDFNMIACFSVEQCRQFKPNRMADFNER